MAGHVEHVVFLYYFGELHISFGTTKLDLIIDHCI